MPVFIGQKEDEALGAEEAGQVEKQPFLDRNSKRGEEEGHRQRRLVRRYSGQDQFLVEEPDSQVNRYNIR